MTIYTQLDQDEYSPMSPGARQAAEATMRKRDRDDTRATGRMPRALRGFDDDDDRPSRRRSDAHRMCVSFCKRSMADIDMSSYDSEKNCAVNLCDLRTHYGAMK